MSNTDRFEFCVQVQKVTCQDDLGDDYFGLGYYFQPVVDDKILPLVAESPEVAMLVGIGRKFDDINSQFAKMAVRMLKLDSEWGD